MLILNSQVDPVSYSSATRNVLLWATQGKSCYVCIANVHVLMMAWDFDGFQETISNADLVTPDGMPLVWMMRLKGQKNQQRVYGPTLMQYVLKQAALDGVPIGLYGSTPEVLDALLKRIQGCFAGIQVAFAWSPPFGEMDPDQDAEIVERINRSGARILFVGLGCPKQEIWMGKHKDKVQAVMLGVGAAFDFHAGLKTQAPSWMQETGLEWLFRLWTEPKRLWKRYLYHNPRFVMLAIADLLGLLEVKG